MFPPLPNVAAQMPPTNGRGQKSEALLRSFWSRWLAKRRLPKIYSFNGIEEPQPEMIAVSASKNGKRDHHDSGE
jgi:hypothetical protein